MEIVQGEENGCVYEQPDLDQDKESYVDIIDDTDRMDEEEDKQREEEEYFEDDGDEDIYTEDVVDLADDEIDANKADAKE